MKQAEAEVVSSSSLVEVKVVLGVEVEVEVEVGVKVEVEVGLRMRATVEVGGWVSWWVGGRINWD